MYQRFSAHLTSVDISGFSFDLSETASKVESALARGASTSSDRSSGEAGSSSATCASKTFDFDKAEALSHSHSRSHSVTVSDKSRQSSHEARGNNVK